MKGPRRKVNGSVCGGGTSKLMRSAYYQEARFRKRMRTALLLDTVFRRRHICSVLSYSTVKWTDIDLWLPLKENNLLTLGVFCSNIRVSAKDVRCYGIFKLGIQELYQRFCTSARGWRFRRRLLYRLQCSGE